MSCNTQICEANNRYIKNYDKHNVSLYILYWDEKKLYGWAMSQKLPVDGFKWKKMSKFNEEFMGDYDEKSNKEYIL